MDRRSLFDRDGFIVIEHFLSGAECELLNAALSEKYRSWREAAKQVSDQADAFACDVLAWDPVREQHPTFVELARHDGLHGVTQEILGEGYGTQSSLVMFSVPGGRGQAWHQDCPPEEVGLFNLNRLMYPEEATIERGAIVVVPGSHRWGVIPPGDHQASIEGERILTPKAGTLVLLHGHVYHRVTPNVTDLPRNSINLRALPPGVPEWITCIGVYRNGRTRFCDTPEFAPAIFHEV